MATRDPVAALTRFLNSLKRRKLKDARMTRAEHEAGGSREGIWLRENENWLIREWQVWDLLMMDSGEAARDQFGNSYPWAPVHWVDEDTALITYLLDDMWVVRLVWRQGEDFGHRDLTDEEANTVSRLNHEALRLKFGFKRGNPPADGPATA